MRIQDIMSSPVETVPTDLAAEVAFERMRDRRVHHLVVLDGRNLAGVISHRDLGGERGASARKGHTVCDLMSPDVVTVTADTTVRQAANRLRGRGIGSLLVVDGEKLVGIVTISDLLELLGRGAQRPVERGERWTLKHRGPRHQKAR